MKIESYQELPLKIERSERFLKEAIDVSLVDGFAKSNPSTLLTKFEVDFEKAIPNSLSRIQKIYSFLNIVFKSYISSGRGEAQQYFSYFFDRANIKSPGPRDTEIIIPIKQYVCKDGKTLAISEIQAKKIIISILYAGSKSLASRIELKDGDTVSEARGKIIIKIS